MTKNPAGSYRTSQRRYLTCCCATGAVISLFSLFSATAAAQSVDNTQTLPDAKPGECYAKVITPARFVTRAEEVIVQEASERIEAVPTVFESVDQRIVVKESSSTITVTPATYKASSEQVEVRARELDWTVGSGNSQRPANPMAVNAIEESGVDLDAVEPGSCFSEHYTPAGYRTELQRVLVKEAGERIETTPAVYETVQERVLVREASSRIVDVPAVFRTEQETVLVEPARSVWKPGRGLVEKVDNATGEIMCLVEVPARYETVTRTVLETAATSRKETTPAEYETVDVQRLVSPASERRVVIPEEYETVEVQRRVEQPEFFWVAKGTDTVDGSSATGQEVCLTERPAQTRTVPTEILASPASTSITAVPAEYRTLSVQRVASEARENRIAIPAKTESITRQVEVEPSRLEWRPVLCETNMTTSIVTEIQRALDREGYDPGVIDGVVGSDTLSAIEAYQVDKQLDRGGITYQTLNHLRVEDKS